MGYNLYFWSMILFQMLEPSSDCLVLSSYAVNTNATEHPLTPAFLATFGFVHC